MFYSVDFDRVFYDFVGNSQDPCTDIGVHWWISFVLCDLRRILEECGSCVNIDLCEFHVHFTDHADIMGTNFRMEVILNQ